jgi:hypothetical protein
VASRPYAVSIAERRLPRQFTPDHVTGETRSTQTGPPTFYISGAASTRRIAHRLGWLTAWGYLSDTGRYGCGRQPQFDGKAGNVDLVAELRAVWWAIQHPIKSGPVTVVTRTTAVAYQLGAWQRGSTDLPNGYTGSARRTAAIEKLRRAVTAGAANLTVHVEDDSSNPLAAGATALTDLAGWWARDNRSKTIVQQRAAELAEAFLADRGRR